MLAAGSRWKLLSWVAPKKVTEPFWLALDFHCLHPWVFGDNPSFLNSFSSPSFAKS